MYCITRGTYSHRGIWINYWKELGGWMLDNDLRVYKTLADARNAVNKRLDGTHSTEPRVLGEAEYNNGVWILKENQ